MNVCLTREVNASFQEFPPGELLLKEEMVLTVDGVPRNRQRFSLRGIWVLAERTVHYVLGHLWIEWAAFFVVSICYASFVRLALPARITLPNGCVNPFEDDFCGPKSEAQLETELLFRHNFIYNYFYSSIFILFTFFYSIFTFFNEYTFFENEHRNGIKKEFFLKTSS